MAMLRSQVDELKRIKNYSGALQILESLAQTGANRDLIAEERWCVAVLVEWCGRAPADTSRCAAK